MQLLVSGATVDVRASDPERIGVLFQPFDKNDPSITRGRTWAADNAAFSGFDANAYVSMLERLQGYPGCRWVAAPDVVADAVDTWRLFRVWEPMLHSLGFRVALVIQDGMTARSVPWQSCEAVFIGGTTRFKLSAETDSVLAIAAAKGHDRHVGRVNSWPRVSWFWGWALTCDGSGFSKWPKRIKLFQQWAERCERIPRRTAIQPEFAWAAREGR